MKLKHFNWGKVCIIQKVIRSGKRIEIYKIENYLVRKSIADERDKLLKTTKSTDKKEKINTKEKDRNRGNCQRNRQWKSRLLNNSYKNQRPWYIYRK